MADIDRIQLPDGSIYDIKDRDIDGMIVEIDLETLVDGQTLVYDAEQGAFINAAASSYTLGTDDNDVTLTDQEGNVQSITVPYATKTDGLAESEVTIGNKIPYNFRATNGGYVSDIGNREINKLVGGTIAWNQLSPDTNVKTLSNTAVVSGTSAYAYTDHLTIIGHVYLLLNVVTEFVSSEISKYRYYYNNDPHSIGSPTPDTLYKATVADVHIFAINFQSSNVGKMITTMSFAPQCFDLTQMFGPTIADYIYELETETEGAGVAYFRNLFPNDYYAYNAGELMSVKTSAHKMIGRNLFDNVLLSGAYSDENFTINSTSTIQRSIKIWLSAGTYTISFASGDSYRIIRRLFDGGYNDIHVTNITEYTFITTTDGYIGLSFRREDNSEWEDTNIQIEKGSTPSSYEPYKENVYPLDTDLELRGIPKLDASNNLYYDGDTYSSDGSVDRKYGIVDLGTLANWSYDSTNQRFYSRNLTSIIKAPSSNSGTISMLCLYYSVYALGTLDNMGIAVSTTKNIYIKNTNYDNTTINDFIDSLSGIYLVYELATSTSETADEFMIPQVCDPHGTEEYVDTRDVAIPVGHETSYYKYNDKEKLNSLPDSTDLENGDYIIKQTNGKMTLSPYSESSDYHVYSTDEQIVGKWIDGNDIYEKTVTVSNATIRVNGGYSYDISGWNVDVLVKSPDAYIVLSSGTDLRTVPFGILGSYAVEVYASRSAVSFARKGADLTCDQIVFTLRYTKTSSNTRSLNLSKGSSEELPIEEKKEELKELEEVKEVQDE